MNSEISTLTHQYRALIHFIGANLKGFFKVSRVSRQGIPGKSRRRWARREARHLRARGTLLAPAEDGGQAPHGTVKEALNKSGLP